MAIQLDFSSLDLQDALDMAVLVEKEAEDRYLMFADQLGQRYSGDAVDFFSMMARNEHRHGMEIAKQRRQLFGDNPSRVTPSMLAKDIEAPDVEDARRYMSPRHALEVAMKSEVKAYEFYDGILQVIRDAAVRKLIENLRNEEAEHQKLLNEKRAKYLDTPEPDFDPEIDELSFHRIRES